MEANGLVGPDAVPARFTYAGQAAFLRRRFPGHVLELLAGRPAGEVAATPPVGLYTFMSRVCGSDWDGDLALVVFLVTRLGLSLNVSPAVARGPFFPVPLFEAAKWGRVAICRFLVGAGALVDAPSSGGWTPIMVVCMGHGQSNATDEDRLEIFEFLVEHGANPLARNQDGVSCLFGACVRGDLEMCLHIISKYGVDPMEPMTGTQLGKRPYDFYGFRFRNMDECDRTWVERDKRALVTAHRRLTRRI